MANNVYLVGKKGANKANSYEAMTNNWAEAEALMKELGPQAEHKVVTVPPSRTKGGK